MKSLFLGTSFSGKVDYETGLVIPEFRNEIENVIQALREVGGFAVFCAVEHENWRIGEVPPEVGVKKDLAEIEKRDVFLGLLHDQVSGGVQYELGFADGKGKAVVIATEQGTDLAYFNQGAANLGRITHVTYETPELLATQIRDLVGEE